MDKTMNIAFIYGIIAVFSLLLACGYCALVRKKEIWLIWLYISVFIANVGYFALSISTTLEEALLANRIAYLGNIFLPLFMMMTIMKVCHIRCPKGIVILLAGISFAVFCVVASQGYLNCYYKDVSLEFINGMAKLKKVYGPLHRLYPVYLFAYFGSIIGVIVFAVVKKRIASYNQAALLAVIVFFNVCIWQVEQLIDSDFEFLSVSYVAGELLLLFLYGMMQDYETSKEQCESDPNQKRMLELNIGQLMDDWPELSRLSTREKDVLQGILQDKRRKEIAEELYITENTVKKHISSIFSKLEVENRNDLFEKVRNIKI